MSSLLISMRLLAQATPVDDAGWSSFKSLVTVFGAPGAIMMAMFWAGHKGWLRWGREVMRERENALEQAKLLAERIESEKKDREDREAEWIARFGKMETEKNMWRDLALQQNHVVGRAVQTAAVATDQLAAAAKGA
jgi:hypothetical protein